MGRRSTEVSKKTAKVIAALTELHTMLSECKATDGNPTVLEIKVIGSKEESMIVELEDLNETLEIMKLNIDD